MDGVLEWAGLYRKGKEVYPLQLDFLREAKRVLKPDGHLAVAIENRYSLESILAMRDTHTNLHFVTVLPRFLANAISKIYTHEPYRTYLYSRSGILDLFRSAGFKSVIVLDLVSSYNDYDFVVSTSDRLSYRFLHRHQLVRSFLPIAGHVRSVLGGLCPSVLGGLSYAYLVLAGNEVSTFLDLEHPVWGVAKQQGVPSGAARFACQSQKPGSIFIVTHDGSAIQGMVEIGIAGMEEDLVQVISSKLLGLVNDRKHFTGTMCMGDFFMKGYRFF